MNLSAKQFYFLHAQVGSIHENKAEKSRDTATLRQPLQCANKFFFTSTLWVHAL